LANDHVTVLVVDDSVFMRRMIADMIGRFSSYRVVGTAADGSRALRLIEQLDPEIVTLDLAMPVLDGFGVLERVMQTKPRKVVVLSGCTAAGSRDALKALELGAIEFVAKPTGPVFSDAAKMEAQLFQALEAARAADVGVIAAGQGPRRGGEVRASGGGRDAALAIAASTGGPRALSRLLAELPSDLGAAVLVVQHMPPGFTTTLAQQLDEIASLPVAEATGGEAVVANRVWIAPGDFHMRVRRVDGKVRIALDQQEPMWGTRPAADALFPSVADVFGPRSVGLVLTGMGRDGAVGLTAIRSANGRTLAQDRATSVVFGMPGRAMELGSAERAVGLEALPAAIAECLASMSALEKGSLT
jgi:two-component system chemotaxis response regulator CheB